jgi:serine protease inhibitor ecotin
MQRRQCNASRHAQNAVVQRLEEGNLEDGRKDFVFQHSRMPHTTLMACANGKQQMASKGTNTLNVDMA